MGDPAGIPASSCAAGDVANARNASFSWGSPIVIRTPSTPYGRISTPASALASPYAAERSANGSQTKLACDSGTS